MKFKVKMESRKFWMSIVLLLISTIMVALPAGINVVFATTIQILSGAEWVSFSIAIYTIYVGGNLTEKHILRTKDNSLDTEQGEKGDTGEAGETGETGSRGERGEKGDRGDSA